MEQLSEGLRAALTPAMVEEIKAVLVEQAEEARHAECALNMALEKTIQDMDELERCRQIATEEWQKEKERLEASVESARNKEQERWRSWRTYLGIEININGTSAENDRQENLSLEKERQVIISLMEKETEYDKMLENEPERLKTELDNWTRSTQVKVDSALSKALATAAAKQMYQKQLLTKQSTVPDMSAPEDDSTDIKSSINHVLQSCSLENAVHLVIKIYGENENIDRKFQKEMEQVMAKAAKKEEKIKAAEVKERKKLEVKMRKELEKIQKEEIKERKRREEKEKKEAKKLAKQRANEERSQTRRSRFFFWRRSSSVT